MKSRLPFEPSTLQGAPKEAGVYRVFSRTYFRRLRGKTNVVHIGKADNLRRRLRPFCKGNRNARYQFENLIKAWFPLSYSFCSDPREREGHELEEYEKRHLELPLLNHQR
jgi:excinuclease UvrABC nuclease subunit